MGKQLTYSNTVTIIISILATLFLDLRSNVLGTKFTIFDSGTNPKRKNSIPGSGWIRKELGAVCYVSVLETTANGAGWWGGMEKEPGQLEHNTRRRPTSWDSEGPGK